MKNYLLVPIQIDAFCLDNGEIPVVDRTGDYAALPYWDPITFQEFNTDTPNLSESVIPEPFYNTSMRLSRGVHLHWALPDALTEGSQDLNFPNVPNRWLIARYRWSAPHQWRAEGQWVVESDYLAPLGVDRSAQSVAVPVSTPGQTGDRGQPYRYLGRNMPLSAWRPSFSEAEYLPQLNATGYGDPTFAAFYPNCFSVFGFHDRLRGGTSSAAPLAEQLPEIRYEVIGWYADEAQDELTRFVQDRPGDPDLKDRIERQFGWQWEGESVPQGLICVGSLCFSPQENALNERPTPQVSVTVANTGTEALSAALARQLHADDPATPAADIENQLEALQLAVRLDQKKLDTMARLREMRHENAFLPVNGGEVWSIRKENAATTTDEETKRTQEVKIADLPPAIERQLHQLNELQKKYDRRGREIDALRQQLFADWYKYMGCMYPRDHVVHDYPEADLVKHFIEQKSLAPLRERLQAVGELREPSRNAEEDITGLEATPESHPESLAAQIARAVNQLLRDLDVAEKSLNAERRTQARFLLETTPASRFWVPQDPVVLVEGEAVTSSTRYGADSEWQCQLFSSNTNAPYGSGLDFSPLFAAVGEIFAGDETPENYQNPGDLPPKIWQHQPWNPFLLEWRIEFMPTRLHSNQEPERPYYDPRFITQNYEMPRSGADLALKPGKGAVQLRNRNRYTGTSLLTPQAAPLLQRAIEHELIERLALFTEADEIGRADPEAYPEKGPVHNLIRAYRTLKSTFVLSQTFDGLQDALRMQKSTAELEVEDPLGFRTYREFSNREVAGALGSAVRTAPQPLNAFHPIRTGCCKVLDLRLVDSFGRILDLEWDGITTTSRMEVPGNPNLVHLPPRLNQAARLRFRWLSHQQNTDESNAHQTSSPVCGWLLPNRLDRSLAFYDAQGAALGYFQGQEWWPAIDSNRNLTIEQIPNPHLRRIAKFIQRSIDEVEEQQDRAPDSVADFIHDFNGTLFDALENIHPENPVGADHPAMLVGRPVAVVRALLNLELSGPPAINQSWNTFRDDIRRNHRTTDAFTRVKFPVRVGEYGRINDGLVGYWLEDQSLAGEISFRGNENAKFFSTRSDYVDTDNIDTVQGDDPINFYQSIDDAPQTMTLLVDVRGKVHASVGILPNKGIDLPPTYWEAALRNIEVTFLQAPLLTPQGKLDLTLREHTGYAWSWVERKADTPDQWDELFSENRIEKSDFVAAWRTETGSDNGAELWDYLLAPESAEGAGWLQPVDDDEDQQFDPGRAKIVADQLRGRATLGEAFAQREETVESIFDRYSVGIDPVETEAIFQGETEIREGWLKLRRV
ncbi:MAG: hypothetical protein AAF998_14375 [Bacteroidota bacterium]